MTNFYGKALLFALKKNSRAIRVCIIALGFCIQLKTWVGYGKKEG